MGDQVLVRQLATKPGKKTKLLPRFLGPYVVERKLSPVNYEIRYSPTKSDILHVQMLKRYYPRDHETVVSLPESIPAEVEDETPPAPPSSPVGRPQHRYNTRYALRNSLVTLVMASLFLGVCFTFDEVDTVLWKTSHRRVIKEVIPINYKIEYQSPCLAFEQLNKTSDQLIGWCKFAFKQDFESEFLSRCHTHEIREKRELFFAAVASILALGAMTGIGVGGYYAFANNNKRLDEFIVQLDIIRSRVGQGLEAEEHITNALKIAGLEMNKTQLFMDMEAKRIHSDIALATVIAHQLATMKLTIRNSVDSFGQMRLTEELLSGLNTTLPCGLKCPVNMTTLITCSFRPEINRLTFGVFARVPSENILVLKSDPFVPYNISGVKYCYHKYVGPDYLLIDTVTKCLVPVPDYETELFIPFTKYSIDCDKGLFSNFDWREWSCSVEHTFDVLQLKTGLERNYLYCYEGNITILSRECQCPSFPFSLSPETNFTVGQFAYSVEVRANVSSSHYLWSEITSRFISHVNRPERMNLEEYYREIGEIHIPKSIERLEGHSYITLMIVVASASSLLFLSLVYFVIRVYCVRRRNRNIEVIRDQIAREAARRLFAAVTDQLPDQMRSIDSPD